ncbi:MAG: CRISPR-associated protein Cas4 [Desulfobacter postgatei]|uniref:CRISPR-associated protein Cas4 n=1 Tax=Desulfobacter postgatei TaxID=2293 RepID=UPI0023F514E8|nr:CRISPR-associated protein Cas4 [Desulfobacter postgatei]MDD4272505.1 CRISPR-associated protein Cas4 [Desulfobacter postgatei]
MAYQENEYLALSALQHILFCPRQCALIHVEQLWEENLFTAQGRVMHERVDRGDQADRGKTRIEYGLPLKSARLGLTGKADVVEFHRTDSSVQKWVPFPVEYKRGKPKKDLSDKVQLCAQAICLEEMLNTDILSGALFYGKTRRRLEVTFDEELRHKTMETAAQLHAMIESGITPPPEYDKKCDTCSFLSLCMPKAIEKKRTVSTWLQRMVREDITE